MHKKRLKIVADEHIWQVESAFSLLPPYDVELQAIPANTITAALIRDADVLLTRSSTRVGCDLLEGSKVRFVATATIGTDHIDLPWLQGKGIAFADAAGSSTGSVVEYMMTALLCLHQQQHINLSHDTLGIIGVGRIGSELLSRCQRLGINVCCNDPPRAINNDRHDFHSLQHLLANCDVLTLHTPLTQKGEHATKYLLNRQTLSQFQGRGIINAARGACIDNQALLNWLNESTERWAVLDCWENEPNILTPLLQHPQLLIGTPHIAGHSLDGKAANTEYIYRKFCQFFDLMPTWQAKQFLPAPRTSYTAPEDTDIFNGLYHMAHKDYPLLDEHRTMYSWLQQKETLNQQFQKFRRHYPVRRAWEFCPWHAQKQTYINMGIALGFSIANKKAQQ